MKFFLVECAPDSYVLALAITRSENRGCHRVRHVLHMQKYVPSLLSSASASVGDVSKNYLCKACVEEGVFFIASTACIAQSISTAVYIRDLLPCVLSARRNTRSVEASMSLCLMIV